MLLAVVSMGGASFAETAAARDASRTIVAVGDIACAPGEPVTETTCRQQQIADLITRLAPDQLWLPGDLQYSVGAAEAFRGSYDKSFGPFRRISRPVPGNHEYFTPGAAGYFGYFGRRAGDPKRGYYSFDAGAWHVVALNSNCSEVPCGYGSRQLRWLARDLRRTPNRCVAAIWHYPLFSSGDHGANPEVKPVWRTLMKARVELGVSGHDHHYEAFRPQDENGVLRPRTGLRQFIVGTGGRSLYPTPGAAANSKAIVQGSFGVLQLRLKPRGWSSSFIAEDGRTLSTDAGRCR